MAGSRNVLIVGVDDATFEKFAPVLSRASFDVDRMHQGSSAAVLIAAVQFHALILGFPIADVKIRDLLRHVRKPESPCRRTPLLILCEPARREDAEQLIGWGVNRVLPSDAPADVLQSTISQLLKVAPRVGLRLTARLSASLGSGKNAVLCQTLNISESGMLIRTPYPFPVGEQVEFEFTLPDGSPLKGVAEVARHTISNRENLQGMGVRFVSFQVDGEERLKSFLASQPAS